MFPYLHHAYILKPQEPVLVLCALLEVKADSDCL